MVRDSAARKRALAHARRRAKTSAIALTVAIGALTGVGGSAHAQQAPAQLVVRGRSLAADAPIKIFFPSGRIRIVAWDRDSIDARGRIAGNEHFYLAGDRRGVKLGIEDHPDRSRVGPGDLVLRVPRRSQLSVKSVSAAISGRNVSGWFYSVSGTIALDGAASSVDAESLAGDVLLDVTAPWERARTGGGRLEVTGEPVELDAATVRGALQVRTSSIVRGRLASVEGDIRYAGTPAPESIFEFSNHAGAVELTLSRHASTSIDLSTITGAIENGFATLRPAAGVSRTEGDGRTLHLQLGGGSSHMTVRTFHGTIRLEPRP